MNCRPIQKNEIIWNLTAGFALISLLFLTGCAVEIVDQNKDDKAPTSAPAVHPEYRLIPVPDQPNAYRIQWRSDLQPEIEPASTSILEGGKSYEFELQDRLLKVDVPTDLVIEGKQLLSELKPDGKPIETKGRTFLKRSASITTLGAKLMISASEIISEGAEILTFNETHVAELGKDGRSGGQVWLKAEKIRGELFVVMRGERGGKGQTGPAHKAPAKAGLTHKQETLVGHCHMFNPGGVGADGAAGFQGERGATGGDTGDLIIDVVETSDFKLQSQFLLGLGGEGGDGGPGQPGGAGGFNGRTPLPSIMLSNGIGSGYYHPPQIPLCHQKRAANGKTGPQGLQGPQGRDGLTGQILWLRGQSSNK